VETASPNAIAATGHNTKHYVNASVNAPSPATTNATPTSRRDSPPRI